MRGLETDHVITGLKTAWGMDIRQTDDQTDRHVDSMTDLASQ